MWLRLLHFLVLRMLPTPLAVLGEFEFALGGFRVLLRPIVVALAGGALKADEFILCHANYVYE